MEYSSYIRKAAILKQKIYEIQFNVTQMIKSVDFSLSQQVQVF